MNVLLANKLADFFNDLFKNWPMILLIILITLLLLLIFFKGFKRTFIVLLSLVGVVGTALTVVLIVYAVTWDYMKFISFIIAWLPTITFGITVVLTTLVNSVRGLRKSLIFMAHSAGAAILWLIVFALCARGKFVDELLVKAVNLVMGENGLQHALNISESANSMRSVLTELVPRLIGGSAGVLISENAAYVYTLADMAFRMVIAFFCIFFYLLTILTLYIFYLIFYSERKYKKKKQEQFNNNQTDSDYKKHRVGGGLVGLARGIVAGILSLSFLGSAFYLAAGKGEGKLKNAEIDAGSMQIPIEIYRSVESYGTTGIFKVLNLITDAEDMPFYLFAVDLVFSGELNDEHSGIKEHIKFREEIGAITGFSRDTMVLLLKYGEDEISSLIGGTATENAFNTVLDIMQNERFRAEFDELIDSFNTPTYLFNFALGIVNSVMAHIDEVSFGASLSDKNKELMKIVFKKGHLSEYIPEDRDLMYVLGSNVANEKNERPYLGAQQIVSKNDVGCLLNAVFAFLSEQGSETNVFNMARKLLPELRGLSLLRGERKSEIDPVLTRVYCFLENAYLSDGIGDCSYQRLQEENIPWTDEINSLLDALEDGVTIYEDISGGERSVLDMLLYIFDEENNENHERDIALYDKLHNTITSSRAVGKVFASSYFYKLLTTSLGEAFEGFYLPRNISYSNKYDGAGTLTEYGELHYLLRGIRLLCDSSNHSIRDMIFGDSDGTLTEKLSALSGSMTTQDTFGVTLSEYLTESNLLRSVLSSFVLQAGGTTLYIPAVCREKDENNVTVNLIVKEELRQLLDHLDVLTDFITECVDGDYKQAIDSFLLGNDDFYRLVEGKDADANGPAENGNRILEGTIASLLVDRLNGSSLIIIPQMLLDNVDNWISVNRASGREMRKFWDALRVWEFSVADLLNTATSRDTVLSMLREKDLTFEEYKTIFNSQIMQYTASSYLFDPSSYWMQSNLLVIPDSACNMLAAGDTLSRVVRSDELAMLFMNLLLVNTDTTIGDENEQLTLLLRSLISNEDGIVRKSEILTVTAISCMLRNNDFVELFKIEDKYRTAGSDAQLRVFSTANIWRVEYPLFLNALDALFGITQTEEDITFDETTLQTAILSAISDPDRREICMRSEIIEHVVNYYISMIP